MYQPPYYPPPEPERPKRRTSRLQVTAGIALIFAIAIGMITISNRMSDQALAVLAGAVCGVGAAIPTSLLIVAISRRREEPEKRREPPQPAYPYAAQPPMIVIAPPGYQQHPAQPPRPEPTIGYTQDQRTFTVLGQPGPASSRWDRPGWEDDPQ